MSDGPTETWSRSRFEADTPASGHAMLLSVAREAALFDRMRRNLVENILRQALASSRLRVTLAALLTTLLWAGLFVLFVLGFRFLDDAIRETSTHDETVRAVYSVFFASLTVMLVISTGIIIYSGLYRSDEATFLLTTPVACRAGLLAQVPSGDAVLSWGFLLLGSPMLVAYGVVVGAAWIYYVLLLPFMGAFLWIPGCVGAIACMLVVRYLPTNRLHILVVAAVVAAGLAIALVWSLANAPSSELLTPDWFLEMLSRLRTTENRLLPSWWLSSGLLEAARSGWHDQAARRALIESVLFLAVTLSNALMLHQIAVWTAGRTYRAGYGVLLGAHTVPPPRAPGLDRPCLPTCSSGRWARNCGC